MSASLQDVMLEFMRLPGARVGAGPLDATCEEPALISVVRKLIDGDSVIASDPDYVSFLKYYSGAALINDDTFIHIWGPARAVADIHWDNLALTNDATYSPVVVASLPGEDRVEFYLSFAAHRKAGVYWAQKTADRGLEVEYFCAGFLPLLDQIVKTKGTFRSSQ